MDKQEADELDWLESNALPPDEDDFDFEDFYPEEIEEEKQPQKQQQNLPEPPLPDPDPPLISDNQITNKKRHASPSKEAPLPEEKRSRSNPSGTEAEEDWLRYSPPPYENIEGDLVVEEKFISRFASEIDGDCISVTGAGGDRVYAKISHVDTDVISKKLNIRGYSTGLISEPIDSLIDKMEQEALVKALEASSESSNKLIPSETPVVNERLWVEKYSPNSFTELLSDEQTNREVLLWLKQWDSCVFGSEIRSTTDDVLSALRRHSSLSQHHKFSDVNFSKTRSAFMPNRTFRSSDELDGVTSNSKRIEGLLPQKPRVTGSPDQKVLLLCGPPGLGKTTLAHVAAKHCGYRVVEINASDDRSASSIEAKILDVVQMNSIMSDAKPKCLIIDEIDGALGEGKGAVEVILKMVASDKKSEVGRLNGSQEEQPGKVSSKQRRKGASLSRPVICICNDLYAPALRPLRQVAKVHIFVQPTINRVVSRLKYICNKEGFRTNSIALTALAEYTECDIRSCLNTLQFLNKKKENLNVLEISSQVVGRKDMSRSAFDVWKEVFQKRKAKRERKSINRCSTMSSDFDHLHALISNRGEYELTMDGIHENMLQLHYHDPMMQKTVKCLNILGVSDHLHRYIMRTQQMSLYAYQPCTAVAIRCLIAQIERPNIEWPKSFYRYRTTFVEKKDLLRCWYSQISPSLSRHLSTQSFVEDSISPLLHILSPPTLRPVAVHLQPEREKDVLAQLVDTMVSYSMTYKKTKPEFVPYIPRHEVAEASGLAFDPPIDEFIKFKGYNCGHSGFPLAMKQVLMHEVEKQKFLRENINRQISSNIGSNMENQVFPGEGSRRELSVKTDARTAYAAINKETAKEKSNPRELKPSTSQSLSTPGANGSVEGSVQLKATVVKKPSGGSSAFFDRFRKASSKGPQNSNQSLQKQATMERDSRPLLFKFNEGFTNAVKRPVRVRDLLL